MGVLKDKPLFTAYMDVARDFGSLYTFWIGMKPVLVCSGAVPGSTVINTSSAYVHTTVSSCANL